MKMKKLLLVISIIFSLMFVATTQNLRRLRLDTQDLVLSEEKVLLYPLGFIYKTAEPDSAFFFSCFSQNKESVSKFIEGGEGKMFASGHLVLRGYDDYLDTLQIESLNDKLAHFSPLNENNEIDLESAEYVLIYYYSDDMLDRFFVRKIRYFKKYTEQSIGKIKLLVVKVE